MGKIFCIIGKSGTGKDTIFNELIKDGDLALKPVILYTTRPKRNNEANGIQYYFIDESKLQEYEKAGKIIEKRAYNSVIGVWYYCTIDDGQIDLAARYNYLLIATLESYRDFKNYFGAENVVPFYITVDDGTRLERALKREKQQQKPNYDELCRRFLADNTDFSPDRLKAVNIEKYYYNNDLRECIESIKRDMLKLS
jgi:guanylate kinase